MGPTIALRNIVGEQENIFLVWLVPLESNFYRDVVSIRWKIKYLVMERGFFSIQVFDECFDAALVLEYILAVVAFVFQNDSNTGIQKRQFPEALGQ